MGNRDRDLAEQIRRLLVQHDRLKRELEKQNLVELEGMSDAMIQALRSMGFKIIQNRQADTDMAEQQDRHGDGVAPEVQLHIRVSLEQHRNESDERYAEKLVQKIVYGAIALMAATFLTALLALVVKKAAAQ